MSHRIAVTRYIGNLKRFTSFQDDYLDRHHKEFDSVALLVNSLDG